MGEQRAMRMTIIRSPREIGKHETAFLCATNDDDSHFFPFGPRVVPRWFPAERGGFKTSYMKHKQGNLAIDEI